MQVLGCITGIIRALVFDIDHTLYYRTDAYLQEGSNSEITELARIFAESFEATASRIDERRRKLARTLGRCVALTETVYDLGITPEQWTRIRCVAWNPNRYISPDPEICLIINKLSGRYRVAFATNSPIEIGRRILTIIGIRSRLCFGPENLGCSKPDPQFYAAVAKLIDVDPAYCVSIGDREFSDGPPALEAGYAGAIIVPGSRDELLRIAPQLYDQTITATKSVQEECHAVR